MKKEKLLKLVMVLIMGIVLLASSVNVFALEDEDDGLGFWQDLDNPTETTDTTDTIDTTDTTEPQPEDETTNNYDTDLPEAGVAENTFAGVAIIVLTITAVYAYKKVNEYKNI